MNLASIISEIDLEISRLQQAKQLLSQDSSGTPAARRGPGRPPVSAKSTIKHASTATGSPKRRTMSAAGRARIAAAQKLRWARSKKAAKKAATAAPAKKAPAKLAKAPGKKSAAAKSESSATAV